MRWLRGELNDECDRVWKKLNVQQSNERMTSERPQNVDFDPKMWTNKIVNDEINLCKSVLWVRFFFRIIKKAKKHTYLIKILTHVGPYFLRILDDLFLDSSCSNIFTLSHTFCDLNLSKLFWAFSELLLFNSHFFTLIATHHTLC